MNNNNEQTQTAREPWVKPELQLISVDCSLGGGDKVDESQSGGGFFLS